MNLLPLLIAIIGFVLVIIARILTNKSINVYRRRVVADVHKKMVSSNAPNPVESHMDEVSQAFLPRPLQGTISVMYSLISLVGYAVVVASFVWAFFSIGWWASAAILALYLLTGFVPTLLAPRR
jgi:hypothetical protein